MNHILKSVRTTFLNGILLLVPIIICIVVLVRGIHLIRKFSDPMAHHFPIDIGGEGKAYAVSILILFLLCLFAGSLLHTKLAQKIKRFLEEQVLIYIPGYSYLQALSGEKLEENHTFAWKPATILVDDNEVICFVVSETDRYCSLFLPSAPTPSSGSVCVREKKEVRYLPITVSETIEIIRRFGRGGAEVLEKMK